MVTGERRRLTHGRQLLLAVVRDPARLTGVGPSDWEPLLVAAERARLLAWLAFESEDLGVASPEWASMRLAAARAVGREFRRAARWEVNRIRRALLPKAIEPVLLKGAAYVIADLPLARGRVVADVDVLVDESRLEEAEAALRAHGWRYAPLDEYDERYYREWMHELPPLHHPERAATLDVHHRILPRTGRLHPPTERLLARSVRLDELDVRVLAPSHMVLHAAAHVFQDGEIGGALRDVVDLHALLTGFSAGPGFWEDLVEEAGALGLGRSLFYALRYAHRLCGTEVPDRAWRGVERWAPPPPLRAVMDWLTVTAVRGDPAPSAGAAAYTLYIRAHWLRMPPVMLARHLARKATRSRRAAA